MYTLAIAGSNVDPANHQIHRLRALGYRDCLWFTPRVFVIRPENSTTVIDDTALKNIAGLELYELGILVPSDPARRQDDDAAIAAWNGFGRYVQSQIPDEAKVEPARPETGTIASDDRAVELDAPVRQPPQLTGLNVVASLIVEPVASAGDWKKPQPDYHTLCQAHVVRALLEVDALAPASADLRFLLLPTTPKVDHDPAKLLPRREFIDRASRSAASKFDVQRPVQTVHDLREALGNGEAFDCDFQNSMKPLIGTLPANAFVTVLTRYPIGRGSSYWRNGFLSLSGLETFLKANTLWLKFCHELGHQFGAADEYKSSGYDANARYGFAGVPNDNHPKAQIGDEECVMRSSEYGPLQACQWTRRMWGWS